VTDGELHDQRLKSLGLMVSEIVHDLNNLFAMVMGHAELGRSVSEPGSELHGRLRDIHAAAVSGGGLCRDMLAYAGKATLPDCLIDPSAMVSELQTLFRVTIPKHAQLDCRLGDALPFLKGDPNHLRQILLNLVMNAVEALEGRPGLISLTVAVDGSRHDANGLGIPGLRIDVQDNGCGMDENVKAKLFLPFFTTKLTGRGLGLTAVHKLVSVLHGELQVDSSPGKGSRFTILLPAVPAPAPAAAAEVAADHAPQSLSGRTVLLVDDEPQLLQIGAAVLKRLGIQTLLAADGEEALACYRANRHRIDLVLLDAVMPTLSGGEVLKAIRSMDPAARVVLISGYAGTDLQMSLGDVIPDAILLKPVEPRILLETVARLMSQQPGINGQEAV